MASLISPLRPHASFKKGVVCIEYDCVCARYMFNSINKKGDFYESTSRVNILLLMHAYHLDMSFGE